MSESEARSDAGGAPALSTAAKDEVVASVEGLGATGVTAVVQDLSTGQTQVLAAATVENLDEAGVTATVDTLSAEKTQVLAAATVESLDQAGVTATVDTLSTEKTQVLASAGLEKLDSDGVTATMKSLQPETQLVTASAAVGAMTETARLDWFDQVVNAMGTVEQAKVRESLAPQDSGDRRVVFLGGFAAAAVLALLFGLIACFADNTGVQTAAIAAAVSVPSIILGGLMGAFSGK